MKIFNTFSRNIQELSPQNPPVVTFYACGPTVYDHTHLGHLRTFTNNDLLKRALTMLGYKIHHVMNITDVGHLTGDTDEGEDKLEKGALKAGKTVWEVADYYTKQFIFSLKELNIIESDELPKATDHIQDMITLIKKLEEKGFTYKTEEAIYFDISKFTDYGKLSGQKIEDKIQKSRDEVHIDSNKKHPADFALWFFTVGRFKDHVMRWDFGSAQGFPGWHIECSAMSMKYLGETIDIHAGGIDHIPVHHENEIAQSEAATGKPFVSIWFHSAFLNIEGQKMSKSLGNFYRIEDLQEKGVSPQALRYLYLQTHYRQPMNFTFEAAGAATSAFNNLKEMVLALKKQTQRTVLSTDKLGQLDEYRTQFLSALQNDLQIPQALAVMWSMLKSNIPSEDKYDLALEFDQVLGLGLATFEEETIPEEIVELAKKRLEARNEKEFEKSDELKKEILEKGYSIEDTSDSFIIKKK
ncbi:cysteine--tRNA ligase [Candidatus Roizmanbacteria bacterium RIFCSPHIGHO2_02_FULL_40_13b]|uniref:Cysteine--tRNA ligase n=1 Tax=Candidatus Roizmanbacteria bacterium RIFCSPHIGHO2_01_FULL_39_24 TaxID=1802032 RepID=A0A1F7GEI0_9BACT|nr:MAG: cysteine--tRNA ligase [Candidatus Roizmanbacteria bacterium RIFCSPHIGHO2_01_FULL_39_24]OGK26226.1 MAG: cysteine--tRNA ligase [Candidatus Roizmanbacteria bacterium RIFCSPHIGHO2_02_FULL_40_13b]OGK50378.1 MAG: cysteine--tRNA ligase [Candidatus Roizmanbacteria bacterium RIFCSPLOWO2_01_FULL_40_32]OGK56221.1 MAG: cysteine--tRNA ligase [Candidatus Roizmanbacteria bacterium RIFCSPLOWO2_02_FULL_39_8]